LARFTDERISIWGALVVFRAEEIALMDYRTEK